MRRLLLAAGLALAFAAPTQAAVPESFVGTIMDGPMLSGKVDLPSEFDTMRAAGVRSLRFSVYWDELQPEKGATPNFALLDAVVGEAAQRRFDLLPVVLRAPKWARRNPDQHFSSPTAAGRTAYAAFLVDLIERYGPKGSYWADNPGVPKEPIRRWQVWNEPNGPLFWPEQPGVAAYVKLLKVATPAIREADPGAKVYLAGLFGKAWLPLRQMYGLGAKGLFDAVAVNPFTDKVKNLLLIVRRTRNVMRDNEDTAPIVATEISYPSAKGKVPKPFGFEVTEKGQAQRVRQSMTALADAAPKLGIAGAYWSTWMSYDKGNSSFDYAGLRRLRNDKVVAKPAFYAFRKVVKQISRG